MVETRRLFFFRLLLTLGSISALAYISACLFLTVRQNYFIFQPSRVFEKTPNIPYQEVWLPVKTGSGKVELINGWWIRADKSNVGTLLYFHGNGINMGANVNQANHFHQLGLSVLLIDYRGYGRSQGGFPSESQVYQDAETAWNYLVKEQKIPAKQIFIYGHSLGGAIAIDLARKHPEAAGAIVQSSFTSMQGMAKLFSYYRVFPISLMLTQRFDSIDKIKFLKVPVLFIHGTDDTVIPAAMSQTLYANAPQPKQLLLVPKAHHNNGDAFFDNRQYRRTIQRFVQQPARG